MKRFEKILALLMLLIYMTASTGSAVAALLCRHHHCHCNHEHVHHSEECVCHGYSFEDPCDGHVHMQYTGAYADRTADSRKALLASLTLHAAIICNVGSEILPPDVDYTGRCPFIDTPPPLSKVHAWAATLRAPPALV